MTEIFDYRWLAKHGDTPSAAWTSMLNKISADQIRLGINRIFEKAVSDFKTKGDAHPPSLPEALAHCLYRESSKSEYVALPTPRASKKVAAKWVRKLKKMLKEKGNEKL